MRTIECHIVMRMIAPAEGAGSRVDAVLRYRSERPWEVELDLPGGLDEERNLWTAARDLFAAGLEEPSGLGDVRLWPACRGHRSAVVMIVLQSPDGFCQLEARHRTVAQFVDRIHTAVPRGHEGRHVDVDRALAALLADPDIEDEARRWSA